MSDDGLVLGGLWKGWDVLYGSHQRN